MTDKATMEIDGATYVIGTLTAFQQLHIARRIAGIMSALGKPDDGSSIAARLMGAVSELPDETVDYIVKTALSVVKRDMGEGKGYSALIFNGQLMYEQIGMMSVLKITIRVIQDNMADFFTELLSGSLEVGGEAQN